nr:integrase, catalytic region, zinc finger, CCHC-type, peptidase aspartic, catalytic [Tanacetum cinerariifolium]
QFCDLDLEVAFRRNACFVRNLEGVDLLKRDRSTNLYTINLHEMASVSPICLMARASSTKSWLWHQRLSHLNFDTINDLARNDLVADDYSRYMWVHFLKSKDEAPEVIIKFLKRITVLLQSPVIIVRTDNSTKFKNQVLKEYFDTVGISHQMSSVRTPQQNGVVKRRNQTLVEAARTIKPDISFLHVFGAFCYPKNDREDIRKLGAKGDIGFFIGYSADSCAYRVYNRRTKKIMETMNVSFDELSVMAFEQRSSKRGLQSMTYGHISSGLDLTYAPSTITMQQPSKGELDLLFEAMYDDYIGGQPSTIARTVSPAQEPQVRQSSTASTTIVDTAQIPTNSSSLATNVPITSQDVDELNPNAMVNGNTKKQKIISSTKANSKFEKRLHLLHMDLCGPIRIASINGKRYVLVIVDDYSRYTWVHFLRSKDEAPKVIIKFLKRITVLLQSPVIIIRTDNSTEFKNQVLKEYFDTVGISHQMSFARTPQHNRVVERRNRTLVEAARTMLIFSRAPLFLWAEAIATACFTQNRSIIHRRFNKMPYDLINGRKPDISFLHVFDVLCYPKNDREDIEKLSAKGDIGFFIGYFADSCAYRVYNRRKKKIMDTMNVSFDELSAMAFEQRSSKPGLNSMTSGHISSGLDLTYAP